MPSNGTIEGIKMDVKISPLAINSINEYAKTKYPLETCGILLRDEKSNVITKAKQIANSFDSAGSAKHFYIDPIALYEEEKKAVKEGLNIVGFFHSHPDCAATISGEDSKYMIPGQIYLIISLTKKEVLETKAYIKDGPDDTKGRGLSVITVIGN